MARGKKATEESNSPFSFDSGVVQAPGQSDGEKAAKGSGIMKESSFGFRKKHSEAVKEGGDNSLFSIGPAPTDLGPQYGYEKKLFGHRNEVSAYTAEMDARHAMDPRLKALVILTVVLILMVPIFVLSPTGWLSAENIVKGPAYFFDLLQSNLTALSNWISGIPDGNGLHVIFWQTMALVFVGAALALNGAVYQGALKNALASPSTLGVMSGGTLGGVIYTLLFGVPTMSTEAVTVTDMSSVIAEMDSLTTTEYILATQGRALCAVAGCFIVVGLVLLIAFIAGRGKVSKAALVIAGQVFASVIAGVVSVIRYYITYNGTEEQIAAMRTMSGGSISYIMRPVDFLLIAIPITIGIIIILRLRFRLNLLAFNDEEARSMGISTSFTRNSMVIVCTIMTAVVVSFCGSVGFVGFIIPHLTRKIVGPDFRYLIPASALLGSIYILVSNYIMNMGNFLSGSLGSFTTFVGVIFFLVTIIQQRRNGNADWI